MSCTRGNTTVLASSMCQAAVLGTAGGFSISGSRLPRESSGRATSPSSLVTMEMVGGLANLPPPHPNSKSDDCRQ